METTCVSIENRNKFAIYVDSKRVEREKKGEILTSHLQSHTKAHSQADMSMQKINME